jgi:hypothetical protein
VKLVREYEDVVLQMNLKESTDSTVDRLSRLCRRVRLLTIDAQAIGYSLEEIILLDRELLEK